MSTLYTTLSRILCAIIGIVWCYVEPTLNYLLICFLAIAIDCYTAWRCNRRIYAAYREAIKRNPKCRTDGKLKSKKMFKMIYDFTVVMLCVILAYHIDNDMLPHLGDLHLANYVSAIFCVIQFVSILENESTCNGSPWARVMQRLVADKTERHFNIKLKELMEEEKDPLPTSPLQGEE